MSYQPFQVTLIKYECSVCMTFQWIRVRLYAITIGMDIHFKAKVLKIHCMYDKSPGVTYIHVCNACLGKLSYWQ